MPKQYVIEHGTENNRWLCRIESAGRKGEGEKTLSYRPRLEEAMILKKDEALAIARKWRARVWQLKAGTPEKLVWPEAEP